MARHSSRHCRSGSYRSGAHRRAGRARRPRDQVRARLRAPPRTAARSLARRRADRRGIATGPAAGAQERHAHRGRPAGAASAGGVRPHDDRAGASRPHSQWQPGDGRARPGQRRRRGAALAHAVFTTRSEGMGLGPSLCRTAIEQLGGVLDFENLESRRRRGGTRRARLAVALAPSAVGIVRQRRGLPGLSRSGVRPPRPRGRAR